MWSNPFDARPWRPREATAVHVGHVVRDPAGEIPEFVVAEVRLNRARRTVLLMGPRGQELRVGCDCTLEVTQP